MLSDITGFLGHMRVRRERLPGFIFYRDIIYLLRIYWDLLAVSVFQCTLILAPALALSLTALSPSKIMWDLFQNV
jgi:hypothetical protein